MKRRSHKLKGKARIEEERGGGGGTFYGVIDLSGILSELPIYFSLF